MDEMTFTVRLTVRQSANDSEFSYTPNSREDIRALLVEALNERADWGGIFSDCEAYVTENSFVEVTAATVE